MHGVIYLYILNIHFLPCYVHRIDAENSIRIKNFKVERLDQFRAQSELLKL